MEINNLDIINVFARFLSVFTFLCIPSKLSISEDEFKRFMLLISILGLVASLYNMIINFRQALNILNISNAYEVSFNSFYLNRNSFAQLLLFSVIAISFLYNEMQKRYILFFYIIYFINIFLTLSRTVLVCSIIFLILSSVIYKRKNIIKSSIIISIIVISLIILITIKPEIRNFIVDMVIRKEAGTSGRTQLWSVGIYILNNTNWVFGIGYITSRDIIKSMGFDLNEFHSFYVETLVGGGIVDLLLHFLILMFIIKRIRIIYKNDKKIGALYLSAYISIFIYSLFESASIFTMGYVGTIFTIFIITVPLLYSNNFQFERTT